MFRLRLGRLCRLGRLGRLGLGQRCYAQTPEPPYWAVIFTSERTAKSKAQGLGAASDGGFLSGGTPKIPGHG